MRDRYPGKLAWKYDSTHNNLSALKDSALILKPLQGVHEVSPSSVLYNRLWQCGWFLSSNKNPRLNWSGFMQCATFHTEFYAMKSTVHFLPIIDMDPNNETCIYSTLCFVRDQAATLKVKDPCITFDQPLWLKVTKIIKVVRLNIVCTLGDFRTIMIF